MKLRVFLLCGDLFSILLNISLLANYNIIIKLLCKIYIIIFYFRMKLIIKINTKDLKQFEKANNVNEK